MDLMTGPAWRWLSIHCKVIGTLAMEFNDHEELVKIKFHKINDLIPFSNQYDCEMTPDYIDGGHGIQVSQITIQPSSFQHFTSTFSGPETIFSS